MSNWEEPTYNLKSPYSAVDARAKRQAIRELHEYIDGDMKKAVAIPAELVRAKDVPVNARYNPQDDTWICPMTKKCDMLSDDAIDLNAVDGMI